MSLYKYVAAERIDVLKHRYIRFSQSSALNDPIEVPLFSGMYRMYYHSLLMNVTPESKLRSNQPFEASLGHHLLLRWAKGMKSESDTNRSWPTT